MSLNFVTKTTIKAIDKASKPLEKIQKQTGALKRAFYSVNKAASGMQNAGRGIMRGVGMPAVLAGANVLRMASSFDEAMNKTQSKLLISKEAMKQLSDEAKRLGATTQFSASNAGEAMSFLAAAGFSTQEIMKSTADTLNLAAAGGLELAQSADIASNVLGAFRLDSKDINVFGDNYKRVTSVLAVASAKSNMSVEEFAESLKTAAPIAAQFGVTIEQSGAMLGMLANMGIKGGESGTAMRNMFIRLLNPVGAAEKAMKKLGITQSDFFKKNADGSLAFKGAGNMMETLKKSKASEKDLIEIFGVKTVTKMMALISAGGGAIGELEKKLMDKSAAAKMAAIRMQGLPGIFKLLASSWEAVNLAMRDSGAFDPIIQGIKKLTTWLQNLSQHPETLKNIAKTIGSVVAAGAGLFAVGTGMKFLANSTIVLNGAISIVSSVTGAIVKMAKFMKIDILIKLLWTKATKLASLATKGLGKAFKFLITGSPIGIMIKLAAVAGLIYANWGSIKTFFINLWISVKAMFAKGVLFILRYVQKGANAFSALIPDSTLTKLNDTVAGLEKMASAADKISAPNLNIPKIKGGADLAAQLNVSTGEVTQMQTQAANAELVSSNIDAESSKRFDTAADKIEKALSTMKMDLNINGSVAGANTNVTTKTTVGGNTASTGLNTIPTGVQ